MLPFLPFDQASFHYSVGCVSNCILPSDTDLINLFKLCSILSQKFISAVVSKLENFSTMPNCQNDITREDQCNVVSSNISFVGHAC